MKCPTITCEKSPNDAFHSLVVYELGYGGQVVDIRDDCVVVKTCILSCVDTVTFSGPVEEMRPLVEIAACVTIARDQNRDEIVNNVVSGLERVRGGVGLRVFYVTTLGTMLYGRESLKYAIVMVLGCGESPDIVKRMGNMSLSDVVTAVRLANETEHPLGEILDELGY